MKFARIARLVSITLAAGMLASFGATAFADEQGGGNGEVKQDVQQLKSDHEQMKKDREKMKEDREKLRADRKKAREARREKHKEAREKEGKSEKPAN